MFYIPRLFIYNTEANAKPEPARTILQDQFTVMMKRLWYGITWPSAILTIIFGGWMGMLYGSIPSWLALKIVFVSVLYAYHFTLHKIYVQQVNKIFKYTSQQLRIWNEIATILLVAIVILVSVKQQLSVVWGILGLLGFIILILSAVKIYKHLRN